MTQIDRIKKLEDYIKEGENKYFNGENKAVYEIFLKCEELAHEINEPKWIAESIKNIGRILHRMGEYEKARDKYFKALEILNENNFISEKPRYLNHLASAYQFTNEFEKQCECLREALKISKELGDDYSLAKINNSIGVYYEIFREYDKALKYMEKAIKFFETQDNDYTLVKSLNLISSVKTKMGDFDDALVDVRRAYEIAKDTNDVYNIAYSLRNIIRIFYNQAKYEECLDYFNELLEIKDKLENKKMNCDILRIIGLVFQKFDEPKKAYAALRDSLNIAKKINYFHGITKSNEFLGDLLFESEEYLESYRFYSNSLNVFQLILNSIKDPKLRETYISLFERLPPIIQKVNSILELRSYELPSKELDSFSNEAINICRRVQDEELDKKISKDCSNNIKKLNTKKNQDFKIRDKIQKDWFKILSKTCFMKLDKETQDYLIRYKLNVLKIPNDYKSFIRKISNAIECEIRVKIFEAFYTHWNNNIKYKLKEINNKNLHKNFIRSYNNLKAYLENDIFLQLRPLYFIISTVIKRYSFNKIPKEYTKPFDEFKKFIRLENMELLKIIVKFFDKKYKCGNEFHFFIKIRNKCSHGGGRIQEKRKKIKIKVKKDTFEEIEKNLINEDIRLLPILCSLEI